MTKNGTSINLIRGASYHEELVDLFISEGRILELRRHSLEQAPSGLQTIEARGLALLPGLIDAHVHLREPGFEHKENIASGLKAAAHGGFCAVFAMANTRPVNDDPKVTAFMLEQAAKYWPSGPRLYPVGGLTAGLKGEKLSALEELAEAGCRAFSNDGIPIQDAGLFRQAMSKAAELGRPLIDHCEDRALAGAGAMNEGIVSLRLGLSAQPVAAESVQVARDALMAQYFNLPVHIAHVSCRQSVEIIRWAKAMGAPLTAETCPHYLLFTEEEVERCGTLAKVNPPLRTIDDLLAVRQALLDGTIDILATDHAPHAEEEKCLPFEQAPFGISGLDCAMSLTWQLLEHDLFDLPTIERLWHHRPAEIFNLLPNRFKANDPADFILFDPEEHWSVSPNTMYSSGKNTPCLGMELPGRVKANFIAGTDVLSEPKL